MCPRLATSVTLVSLLFGTSSCRRDKDLGEGAYLATPLLARESVADIDKAFERFGFIATEKKEVLAGKNRFLFITDHPYRGLGIVNVYCYEEIKSDEWILRALIPIRPILYGENLNQLRYLPEGNTVNVVFNETILLSVKGSEERRKSP
jgi:hypothetical protein